jgi:hypothetical protein
MLSTLLRSAVRRPCRSIRRPLVDIHDAGWDLKSDVMLTDVSKEDVIFIQKELGHDYLSTTTKPAVYPVNGLVFNAVTRRLFVSLIVTRGNVRINVTFLVDSSCSGIYVTADTMSKLGYTDVIPNAATVNIHGFDGMLTQISPDQSAFRDLNVLGQQFFQATKVQKYEDTANGIFKLFHPTQILSVHDIPSMVHGAVVLK